MRKDENEAEIVCSLLCGGIFFMIAILIIVTMLLSSCTVVNVNSPRNDKGYEIRLGSDDRLAVTHP